MPDQRKNAEAQACKFTFKSNASIDFLEKFVNNLFSLSLGCEKKKKMSRKKRMRESEKEWKNERCSERDALLLLSLLAPSVTVGCSRRYFVVHFVT